MAKIITHAPSKAYDEGWDAIFGKKEDLPSEHESKEELPTETERALHEQGKWLPGGGVRMPRGWTPKAP